MNEKFHDIDCGCGRGREEYDRREDCRERSEDCREERRDRDGECRENRRGRGDDCGCGRQGDHDGGRDHGRYGNEDKGRTSDRAKLLRKIQELNFMMIETGLFLNNQCGCEAAQEAFCEYQRRHAEAKAEYEACYGPLTYEGVNVKRDGWSWINGPWPWEVEDC